MNIVKLIEDMEITQKAAIKGRDLPGGVNVLPVGLSEALAKRESKQVKVGESSTSTTYSSSDINRGQQQTQTFAKQQSSSISMASSSMKHTSRSSDNSSLQLSSSSKLQQSSSSFQQKSNFGSEQIGNDFHHAEIKQEHLKNTIQSAITDIEKNMCTEGTDVEDGMDEVDLMKENVISIEEQKQVGQVQKQDVQAHHEISMEQKKQTTDDLSVMTCYSPSSQQRMPNGPGTLPCTKVAPSEHNGSVSNCDYNGDISPSGLEKVRLRLPRDFKSRPGARPVSMPVIESKPMFLPDITTMQPRKSSQMSHEESSFSSEQRMEMSSMSSSSHMMVNGYNDSEQRSEATKRSESVALFHSMLPVDYDSSSLKRRNPRQMFTDSSFYSSKFHPTVADQVEMAHKLSSSLFVDGNATSKGQDMFLRRAQKTAADDPSTVDGRPQHHAQPNLKLVMNPRGKVHDWTDLEPDDLPEMHQVGGAITGGGGGASQSGSRGDVVERLQSCKGRGGKLFAKRRKKADTWVVDESAGKGGVNTNIPLPSEYADQFIQQQSQQQKQVQNEREMEEQAVLERHNKEKDRTQEEQKQMQQEQQKVFQQQQQEKQQKSLEVRQEQESKQQTNAALGAMELPPDFKPCCLKATMNLPKLDLSIHNVQGIDVWASRGPRPFTATASLTTSSNTLSRMKMSTGDQTRPTAAAAAFHEPRDPSAALPAAAGPALPQVAICPSTPFVDEAAAAEAPQQHQTLSASLDTSKQQQHLTQEEDHRRMEYEKWFKTQELEQQALEYECRVKYEVKNGGQ